MSYFIQIPFSQRASAEIVGVTSHTLIEAAQAVKSFSSATTILDVGSGTGEVVAKLFDAHASSLPSGVRILATDIETELIPYIEKRKALAIEKGETAWKSVEVKTADASKLDLLSNGEVSHVLAGLVLFFLPNPQDGVKEIHRVLAPGGIVAASSWMKVEWGASVGVLQKIRPEVKTPMPPQEWASTEGVKGELEKCGFKEVKVNTVEVVLTVDKWEDLMKFAFTWPVMKKAMQDWSDEEKERALKIGVEDFSKQWPGLPAKLKGTAIIGTGKK